MNAQLNHYAFRDIEVVERPSQIDVPRLFTPRDNRESEPGELMLSNRHKDKREAIWNRRKARKHYN